VDVSGADDRVAAAASSDGCRRTVPVPLRQLQPLMA
jgi:hypothetical protein